MQENPPPLRWPSGARFRPTPETLARSFEDRIVLVHMNTDKIHVLNRTAARLWELACSGIERAAIQEKLSSEFEVAEAELADEVDRMLTALADGNFLEPLE